MVFLCHRVSLTGLVFNVLCVFSLRLPAKTITKMTCYLLMGRETSLNQSINP